MLLRAKRKGSVLIVALGMMTVLVVLGLVFLSMTRVERATSRNYVDMVRAKMLAQSGIEYAISTLSGMLYWGSDGIDNDNNGLTDAADPGETQTMAEGIGRHWMFGCRVPAPGVPTVPAPYHPGAPLEEARFVSFQQMANPTTHAWALIDTGKNSLNPPSAPSVENDSGTRQFGVSGQLTPTYPGGGDFFALKITDCQGKIFLDGPDTNDGNPDPTIAATVTALAPNVRMTLNTLGNIISSPIANLGDQLSAYRASTGRNIGSEGGLYTFLLSLSPADETLARTRCNALLPHVTPYAWVDYSTLAPNALVKVRPNDPTIMYNTGFSVGMSAPTRHGEYARREVPWDFETHWESPFWAKNEIFMSCSTERTVSHGPGGTGGGGWYGGADWTTYTNNLEVATNQSGPSAPCRQPRAPVNINTASREALIALLNGLRGTYMVYNASSTQPQIYMGDGHSPSYEVVIDGTVPAAIADRIIQKRNSLVAARGFGFAAWHDFNRFVDGDPADPFFLTDANVGASGNLARARRNLIKANFNPNSRLNKFNHDRVFGTRFGETDKGDLSAWTTEFCFFTAGTFKIESLGRVLGPSDGTGSFIAAEKKVTCFAKVYEPYRHNTQAEFFHNRVTGVSTPLNTLFFPENMNDLPADMAAEYDGRVGVPTTDMGGTPGTNYFQAHYTSDFDLYQNGVTDQNDKMGPAEEGVSLINPLTGGGGTGGQSELFPDGLFVHECRRYPAYAITHSGTMLYGAQNCYAVDDYVRYRQAALGKMNMVAGTVDMWVKPTWSATEFPFQPSTGSFYNPIATGSRVFFSFGYGANAWPYSYLGGIGGFGGNTTNYSYCDNRVVIMARSRGGNSNNTYVFGFQTTRTTHYPANWFPNIGLAPLSQPLEDVGSGYGKTSANYLYVQGSSAENLYAVGNSPGWNPRNWTHPGVWHHLQFGWENGNRAWLFVDGVMNPACNPYTGYRLVTAFPNNTFGTAQNQDTSTAQVAQPNQWSLFPGTSRFQERTTNGYVCSADCTIDDLKVYNYRLPNTGNFIPPHRTALSCVYESVIGPPQNGNPMASIDIPFTVATAGRVAFIGWTALFPKFSNCSSTLSFRIETPASGVDVVVPPLAGYSQELEGRGVPIGTGGSALTIGAGETLRYRATFSMSGMWRSASPFLDDVTILIVPASPVFLAYFME